MSEDPQSGTSVEMGQGSSALGSVPADDNATVAAAKSKRQALIAKGSSVAERVKSGTMGTLWSRLNAVDFMNSALQLAALTVVCVIPVLIVVDAVAGRDARHTIIVRLGLNPQAAKDVEGFISNGHAAVATLTVTGAAFLFLSALALASTLQGWYERVFDQPPSNDWKKQLLNRVVWLVGAVFYIWLEVVIGSQTGPLGGRLLIYLGALVVATLFWWWTVHILLYGRIGWRALFPTGLATGICLTGLGVFSALLFSNTIISDHNSYGPIGVMMGLLSYCIGFGVCLHLGAVGGRMWSERHGRGMRMT
jgi:membrane protein